MALEKLRREGCMHRRIARRIQYALPVVEKPSYRKLSEGVFVPYHPSVIVSYDIPVYTQHHTAVWAILETK